MKNDIICSIIIRSYNEEKHIGRLIDGINKQKNVTGIEIIVVDSGSTDSTTYIAHKMGASVISIRSGDFPLAGL